MTTPNTTFAEIETADLIHRWSAEFIDPSKEHACRTQSISHQRILSLAFFIIATLSAPLQVIAAWPNVIGDPAEMQSLILGRVITVLIYGVLFFIALRTKNYRTLDILALIAITSTIFNTFLMQPFGNPDGAGLIFRGLVTVILIMFLLETRLSYFFIFFTGAVGAYLHQIFYFFTLSVPETQAGVYSLLITWVFALSYRWQKERRRRQVYALNFSLVELHEELQTAIEKLEKQSLTDPLTGLANRRAYEDYLKLEDHRSRRGASNYAIAIMDIDHFKAINDTYGHDVGDLVLIGLADILSANARDYEMVARIGGEEFAIVFTQIEQDQAVAKLNSLRQQIEKKSFRADDTHLSCSVSIGIAMSNAEWTYSEVQKFADEALYEAKRSGRNRVCIGSPQ